MAEDRIGVLFVCLGNICRSPLAEAVFRHLATDREVHHLFEIDSAGTSGYHVGDPPDARAVATARGRGISVEGAGRRISAEDLHRFDYVIAMDRENYSVIDRMSRTGGGKARVHLLREWDEASEGGDVPDPYYGGPRGFEEVHDIVERSCERLIDHLLSHHHSR